MAVDLKNDNVFNNLSLQKIQSPGFLLLQSIRAAIVTCNTKASRLCFPWLKQTQVIARGHREAIPTTRFDSVAPSVVSSSKSIGKDPLFVTWRDKLA